MALTFPSRAGAALCIAGRLLFTLWLTQTAVIAQTSFPISASTPEYREDQILIKPKQNVSMAALRSAHATLKSEVVQTFEGIGRMQVLRVPKGETVQSLIAKYQQSGLVEFAEPDYIVHAALTPNDPKYTDGTLWGLNNTGQSGGTNDADIDAPEGWDVLTSASNIVVAVLDTGVRASHEDLTNNMWVNPLDGSHGWNAIATNNNPDDDGGHGTLVSGVLGGYGNNGKGVAGVAWRVQIMAGKCLDSGGTGSDSTLIACIDFARTNGARIINASLDSAGYSEALSNAIVSTRDAGIIFIASAGNKSVNIDATPRYPSCYDIDNIISVAATTRADILGGFSNYGATNVDLAAPGADMYSTFFGSDSSYLGGSFLFGTSLVAPYVAGACALVWAKYPTENYQQIIRRVLNGTDPLPALAGKCTTGGRLNLRKALGPAISLSVLPTPSNQPFQLRLIGVPNRTGIIEATTNLPSGWSPVFTNTISTNGNFDFMDNQSTNLPQRFYRGVAAP